MLRVYPGGYADLLGSLDQAAAAAGLTAESVRDTAVRLYWLSRVQNDAVTLRFQMPHAWDFGAVRPHLHLLAAGDATGTIYFDGYYTWTRIGSGLVLPALSGWTTFTATREVTAAEQYQEVVIDTGLIAPPAAAREISAHLWVYVRRVAALDTYEGDKTGGGSAALNLGLVSFDCHVRLTGFGSETEF